MYISSPSLCLYWLLLPSASSLPQGIVVRNSDEPQPAHLQWAAENRPGLSVIAVQPRASILGATAEHVNITLSRAGAGGGSFGDVPRRLVTQLQASRYISAALGRIGRASLNLPAELEQA